MKKAVSIFLLGSFVSQLSGLVSLPFITRSYSSESVGLLATFLTFFSLFSPLLALRFESFLVVEYEEALKYFHNAAKIIFFNSTLVSFFFFIYLYTSNDLTAVDVIISTLLLFFLLFSYGSFLINKSLLLVWENYPGASISQNLRVTLASLLKLAFIPFGFLGLILSEVIGSVFSTLLSKKYIGDKLKLNRKIAVNNFFWPIKYSLYESLAILLNQVFMFLPTLYIGLQYSILNAGQFWLAYKVISLPNTQLGTAISDAYFRKLTSLADANVSILVNTVFKVMLVLILFGFLYYGAFFFFGEYLFEFVFGNEWVIAGQLASTICIWRFSSLITAPLSRVIIILGKQKIRLYYDLITFFTLVIFTVFSYDLNHSIIQFATYLSYICAMLYLLLGCIIITLLKRKRNENCYC